MTITYPPEMLPSPAEDSKAEFIIDGQTFVLVPAEPTQAMLHACQAAMKNFIRSLTPEERKARGWKAEMRPKDGYRIQPYEKGGIYT